MSYLHECPVNVQHGPILKFAIDRKGSNHQEINALVNSYFSGQKAHVISGAVFIELDPNENDSHNCKLTAKCIPSEYRGRICESAAEFGDLLAAGIPDRKTDDRLIFNIEITDDNAAHLYPYGDLDKLNPDNQRVNITTSVLGDTEGPQVSTKNWEDFWKESDPSERVSRITPIKTANDTQVGGKHYRELAIQPWDFIHRNKIGFLEGSAIAYIARHKEKNGAEDIQKAIHFLQKLLEEDYAK